MSNSTPEKMTTIALHHEISTLRPRARSLRDEAQQRHDRISGKINAMPAMSQLRRAALQELQKLDEIILAANTILGNVFDD